MCLRFFSFSRSKYHLVNDEYVEMSNLESVVGPISSCYYIKGDINNKIRLRVNEIRFYDDRLTLSSDLVIKYEYISHYKLCNNVLIISAVVNYINNSFYRGDRMILIFCKFEDANYPVKFHDNFTKKVLACMNTKKNHKVITK